MSTTESDRSASYESDPLVRVIEDAIRSERAERRLYPDLYSERVAAAVREELTERMGAATLPRGIWNMPRVKQWFIEGVRFAIDSIAKPTEVEA